MSTSNSPPGPDDSIASQLLIPCGTLQGIVIVTYTARMIVRLRPANLWWDDYTITLATVSAVNILCISETFSPSPVFTPLFR
jgi:hypothetical protein